MENNNTRREAALLVFVVFVLGIFFGGVADHLWGVRVWGQQTKLLIGRPTRDQVISNFTRELQLTPAQQQLLATIVDDTRARWRALYAPLDAQHEEIRQLGRDHIRAILTPEQKVQFEDFMRRLDEQRKKDEAR